MYISIIQHTGILGGASKSLIDLSLMLMRNHEVEVCIPKDSPQIERELEKNNIKYREISAAIPKWLYYSGGNHILSKATINLLRSLKRDNIDLFVKEIVDSNPDIVFFNSMVSTVSAQFLPNEVVKIGFVRETFNRSQLDNIFKNIFENHLDGLCFIAESELRYLNLNKTKTVVIPDCLIPTDVKEISKEEACTLLGLNQKKFNVLYLGGLQLIKGPDILLKTFEDLNPRDYHLVMAGSFDESKLKISNILKSILHPRAFRFYSRVRGVYYRLLKRGSITNLGFVSGGLYKAFCACDAIVFPSTFPHQPRPGIEAGIYNKPVILTDFNVTEEFFINGFNALTFKNKDSRDLKDKIEFLRNNPQKCIELGKNNHTMSIEKHNYYEVEKSLLQFIDEVCRSSES